MIYEELVHGEYMYMVTDDQGRLIAETYDLGEAELILSQFRAREQGQEPKKYLHRGVAADPKRS